MWMGFTVVGRKKEESEISDECFTGDERWRTRWIRKGQGYGRCSQLSRRRSTATSTSASPSRSRFLCHSSFRSLFFFDHGRRLSSAQAIKNNFSRPFSHRLPSKRFPSPRLSRAPSHYRFFLTSSPHSTLETRLLRTTRNRTQLETRHLRRNCSLWPHRLDHLLASS